MTQSDSTKFVIALSQKCKRVYKIPLIRISDNCNEVACRIVSSHQSYQWEVVSTFIWVVSQGVRLSRVGRMKDLNSKAKRICKKTQIQLQNHSIPITIHLQHSQTKQFLSKMPARALTAVVGVRRSALERHSATSIFSRGGSASSIFFSVVLRLYFFKAEFWRRARTYFMVTTKNKKRSDHYSMLLCLTGRPGGEVQAVTS